MSWATTRVGVHRLSLRLPYLGVFPFTLRLPLDFIGVFPLRPTYLHPFGLALEPDVVVPEADQGCAWCRNFDPNFCPGRGRTSEY